MLSCAQHCLAAIKNIRGVAEHCSVRHVILLSLLNSRMLNPEIALTFFTPVFKFRNFIADTFFIKSEVNNNEAIKTEHGHSNKVFHCKVSTIMNEK